VASSTDETLLVLRARSGDREALELLLRQVCPALRKYIAMLVGPQDADDVVQDGLIQICRNVYWLEHPDRFRAWAYRICSRLAFRHLRAHRRARAWLVDNATLEDFEGASLASGDVESNLDTVLEEATLSPPIRAVLLLHFREQMPLAEVAAVLEVPLGTVKSRLSFGLKALRKALGAERRR
jgi:RNA polymerase sigma-70 factor, ECF subfamily